MAEQTLTSSATLSLQDVDIVRGGRVLIAGLSLMLDRPQILWVEGGNGIGKTSLLRTCAGLSKPEAGEIAWQIDGASVTAPQAIGFLPADSYAKPGLSAGEDAAFWNATDALPDLGLAPHEMTRTEKLSTGQAKRLALAKLVSAEKPIWILDEPLAGLDMAGRDRVARLLVDHVKAGGIALIASHAPIALDGIFVQRLKLS